MRRQPMRRTPCAARTRHAPHACAHTSRRHARTRTLPLLLLAALLCPCASRHVVSAQTPAAKAAAAANATVSGRVTTTDGKPVANIGVALTPADSRFDRERPTVRAATDAEGRYRATGVAAGRYRVQALAPLYASPDERANSPFESGKVITVSAGESIENIDVTLVRGGVITGRVTGPDGRPVIAERVYVTDADQTNPAGARSWVVSPFDFETDDRGVYRIYGVPPGRYVVSVGVARGSGMITTGPTAARYQRTFYPGTTDPSQAKPVEVTSAGEASGVDISMAEAPKSYEARGRIVDEEGKPVAGIGYGFGSVRPDQPVIGAWGSDGSLTNEAGEFVVRNLMPGRYAVFASAADYGATPLEVYSDAVQFEVADENVEGLVVKVHRGASISGTVVVEGTTDRAVLARVAQLNVITNQLMARGPAAATDQLTAPGFSQTRVNADGTFRVSGLHPGKYGLNVFSAGPQRAFTMLGVQRAGADASAGIDVGEGEQLTGVRVRVGYGTGVIRGQIDLRDAGIAVALPPGARVNVGARRVGAGVPGGAATQVDARGHFVIENLLAGQYDVTVMVFVPPPPGAGGTPARPRLAHQTVSVADGGETNVTITLDLSQQTERNP